MYLNRRRAGAVLLPLVAMLSLGACSNSDEPSPTESPTHSASSAPTPSSTSEAQQPTATPSEPSSDASPATSGEKVSKEQIQAAIDDFVARHEGAQQIPGSDIKPSELDETAKGVKVEPKECEEAYTRFQDPDLPQNGKTHVALHRSNGYGDIIWLSISEFDTAEDADQMMKHDEDPGQAQCDRLKIEANGVKLTVEFEDRTPPKLEDVQRVTARKTVETIPGGASTTTHSVVALKGNLMIMSSLSSVEDNFTPEQADAVIKDALKAMNP
ncbi:MAG: DUF5642 family protein [Propionibacteriaceae bacterium]|nr:DUF5642 family protein [Propionibacteriaceae bacterium]